MKHPFHTLFYIGFFTMVFIGGFLSLVLLNLKDILPSSFEQKQLVVVSKDIIVPTPIETLTSPTPPIKPIEKVVPKEISKINTIPEVVVPKPTVDSVIKVEPIDSLKTP